MTTFRWTLALVIAAIAVELVSPFPALLTLGTILVLILRPAWFLRFVKQLYAADEIEEVERTVIACARRHHNHLTVMELAAGSRLTLADAEAALRRLAVDGRVSSFVDDDGVLVYNFGELMTPEELPPGPSRSA